MILGLSYVSGPNFSLIRSVDLSKVLEKKKKKMNKIIHKTYDVS